MNGNYVSLSYTQVGLTALLVLAVGAMSVALRLGLCRSLLWAATRTMLQLFLVGLVLEWVFDLKQWEIVLVILICMTLVAGVTAVQRGTRRFPGIWLNTLLAVWASSWSVTAFAMLVVLEGKIEMWYQPQFVIPFLGMILGNALNGVSLGQSALTDQLVAQRHQVDAALALGATRWEAARPFIRQAIRTGMIPIINTMSVVGLVNIPGMMTGQLLAGARPEEAVKYQILIMFLIAAATALGTVSVVILNFRRLFTADHQLRVQWIDTVEAH